MLLLCNITCNSLWRMPREGSGNAKGTVWKVEFKITSFGHYIGKR